MSRLRLSLRGRDVEQATEITASSKLRAIFVVAAAVMFSLWVWSLIPPIKNWGNPNEDGFFYVSVFYATLVCLPAGFCLFIGAIAGRGNPVTRARTALFIGGGMTLLVVMFLIVQKIANDNDGKVFGIQIGVRLNHQVSRKMTWHAGGSIVYSIPMTVRMP